MAYKSYSRTYDIRSMMVKLLILSALFIINISCSSAPTVSQNYISYILDSNSVPSTDIKHKSWDIVYDTKDGDIKEIFSKNKCVYYIAYPHVFDSISVPNGCEIHFAGGSLKGKVIFNKNFLSGKVKLHDSQLFGMISNKQFETVWNCYGDGQHDDAYNINQAISVCNVIHFQKGTYLMESFHKPVQGLNEHLHDPVKAHIGVYKSGISFLGEEGATLLTKDAERTIAIYTQPYKIQNSIRHITITKLAFRCENDGIAFNEFSHTIKVLGVNGLRITKCKFFDFFGDAICLSHYGDDEKTGERTRNSNVTISNNYIEGKSHNNRNAISVINGYNVLIDNNIIEEVSKNNMPGAIDVEPNNSAYTINGITISNNQIRGSRGSGAAISVVALTEDTPTYNILIKNNQISQSTIGIGFFIKSVNTSRNFSIEDNVVDFDTPPLIFNGRGVSKDWTFKGNKFWRPTKVKIGGSFKIENLQVK